METRQAVATLELNNRNELQQGHKELKIQLQKERSQITVKGQPEHLGKTRHFQKFSTIFVTHRGLEGRGRVVPAQITQKATIFEGKDILWGLFGSTEHYRSNEWLERGTERDFYPATWLAQLWWCCRTYPQKRDRVIQTWYKPLTCDLELANLSRPGHGEGKKKPHLNWTEDLQRLMVPAYTDTTEAFLDTLAMDQFIDDQLDLNLQIKTSERRPETLERLWNLPWNVNLSLQQCTRRGSSC